MFTFVGSEYGIVLLSTVRSLQLSEGSSETADIGWIRKRLGFVADPHRICVGITRCKFGLVIVGKGVGKHVLLVQCMYLVAMNMH